MFFRASMLTVFVSLLVAISPTAAQAPDTLQDTAVDWLQRYLRVDTINPPGNENRAVEFFAAIFDEHDVAFESAESAPGRGNIWARLEGGDKPALVLLHHSDVVPADPQYWDEDPLSGAIRDGYLYGRGALDTKGLGILHLAAFLELHRRGQPLNRDVLFLATADEEAGGFYGAGWLVENRPELFEDVGLLLNEGGGGQAMGERQAFSVEVTQKVPLWLHLTTHGVPGHGSSPRVESAVNKMVRALANLERYDFEARAVPAVRRYVEALAELRPEMLPAGGVDQLLSDSEALLRLQLDNPRLHALLRNTCSITRLEGSSKINVVPPEASAELDCRLLPDQDHEAFLAELRTVLAVPDLEIETIMAFTPAVSPTDNVLYEAILQTVDSHYPAGVVMPSVSTGFTDSHFFRDLDIVSYGFSPVVLAPAEAIGVHGNNERVQIAAFREAVGVLVDVLEKVVY